MTDNFNTIFEGCTNLTNVSGLFMNTHIKGNVSNLLFDSCRDYLTNASYIFYGTQIDFIDVGKAKINYYKDFTLKYNEYLKDLFSRNVKRVASDEIPIKNNIFYEKYVIGNSTIGEETGLYKFIKDINEKNIDTDGEIEIESLGKITIWGVNKAYDDYLEEFYEKYTATQTNGQPFYEDFYGQFFSYGVDFFKENYNKIEYEDLLNKYSFVFDFNNYYYNYYLKDTYELNISYSNRTNLKNIKFYNNYVQPQLHLFEKDVLKELELETPNFQENFGLESIYSRFDYEDIVSNIDVIELGLFSNCKELTTLNYAFANCFNLKGSIPADMFYGSKNLENLTQIVGLFRHCHLLSCYNNDGSNPQLSTIYEDKDDDNWQEETDIKGLKEQYSTLKGGNYQFVYPNISNKEEIDGEGNPYLQRIIGLKEKQIYLVPEDWLQNCPRLDKISGLFLGVGSPRRVEGSKIAQNFDNPEYNSNRTKLNILKVPNNLFQNITTISDASNAFREISTIGITSLNSTFMGDSSNNLKNIENIFSHSKMYSVGDSKNNVAFKPCYSLTNANGAFYFANRLDFIGDGKDFTDIYNYDSNDASDWYGNDLMASEPEGSLYKSIKDESGLNGYGVDFSDKNLFSKISANYSGAFAGVKDPPFHMDSFNENNKNTLIYNGDINESSVTSIPNGISTTKLATILDYTLDIINSSYTPGTND